MGSGSHLSLLESNDDLMGPSCDLKTVKAFLSALNSSGDLQNCSVKEVKVLISRANTSLHSANKLRGLLIIDTLLEGCNGDVFEANAIGWLTAIASRVLDSKDASHHEKELSCSIINSIFKIAPGYTDVAKQIPALTGGIVSSVLKNFEVSPSFLTTLTTILKTFPGSTGATEKIRKKVLGGFDSTTHSSKQLSKCASFLPRLGGSGKEGANHKAAWSLYLKRFIKTYHEIQENCINISATTKMVDDSEFLSDIEPIKELFLSESRRKDLLANSYGRIKQLSVIKDLICEFLKSPFPFVKIFQPALLIQLSDRLFNTLHLLTDGSNISEEFQVLKSIYPKILTVNLSLLNTLIKVCNRDVAPFVSKILKYISQALECSVGQFDYELKMSAYRLCRNIIKVLGASSGVHIHAESIIPKLFREVVPIKASNEDNNSVVSSSKGSRKSKEKNTMWKNSTNKSKRIVSNIDKRGKLVSESLSVLSDIFLLSGSLIPPSFHKDVQIVVLRLCIDTLHQENLRNTCYSIPTVRIAIYNLLVSLSLNPHFKFHSPLRYAVAILSKGLNDAHHSVQRAARSGLSQLEPCFHSRSPYLGSEVYLSDPEVQRVMNEIVKVHETKIYVKRDGGKAAGVFISEDSQRAELDNIVQNVISSTSEVEKETEGEVDKSSEDFMEVENVTANRLPSLTPEMDKKVSEMEEIIKESKKKNSDEELIQTFYNQDKSPVIIPDETLEKFYAKDRIASSNPSSNNNKKIKLSEEPQEDPTEDGLDLNEMLSSFVHKPELSTLKRKFKDDYVDS